MALIKIKAGKFESWVSETGLKEFNKAVKEALERAEESGKFKTAFGEDNDKYRCKYKPFTVEELENIIKRTLDEYDNRSRK